MNQVVAVLTSRKARIPLVCVAGSVALLLGLIWGGILNVEQTAVIVVAGYVLSKIGMATAAIWVGSSQGMARLPSTRPRVRLVDWEIASVDFRIEGPRAYLDNIELSGDARARQRGIDHQR